MKRLLILSGKGGTGKTIIASAFIEFSRSRVFADCDVDAPNLHLIVDVQGEPRKSKYYGLQKAKINLRKCISCGECKKLCKFDAIKKVHDGYIINEYACEGCGVCILKCPTGAIELIEDIAGDLILYKGDKNFSTAKLKMGRGNSGMLVTKVKEQLKDFNNSDISVIDGSPGIGCPVIASISDVDFVLIVAEPSVSGISDMKRIINTVKKFNIDLAVCVNKYDICIEYTDMIEEYCKNNNINFVGRVSYDENIPKAINKGENIAKTDCQAKQEILEVYNKVIKLILNKEDK